MSNSVETTGRQSGSWFLWLLISVLLVRLVSLALYPLADTTEARYAEIARLMLESGNWITLYLDADTPFLGKPPLYAWITALSFSVFGITEWAARLPQWIFGIGVLVVLFQLTSISASFYQRLKPLLVLSSSLMFFVALGAVMTDMALLLSVTGALAAFWFLTKEDVLLWRLCFGLLLGLGMLAKGPVALILVAIPVLSWILIQRRFQLITWLKVFQVLLVIIMVAGPWYVAAELQQPGFLDYFLIGEHFLRFIQPGWTGDLYGSAHDQTRGTIWIYLFAGGLPWIPLFLHRVFLLAKRRQLRDYLLLGETSGWRQFLLLWFLAPPVFFTFSGNILPAYILPSLPALALLFVDTGAYLGKARPTSDKPYWFLSPLAPILLGIALISYSFEVFPINTEKYLIAEANHLDSGPEAFVYYLDTLPMSARFYSRGRVRVLNVADIDSLPKRSWIAARTKRTEELASRCPNTPVFASSRYGLFLCE